MQGIGNSQVMKTTEDYALFINSRTGNFVNEFISREYPSFDLYRQREIDHEVEAWIEGGGYGLSLILGEAGLGKTSLLCTLAEKLIYQGQSTVIFVEAENLLEGQFDKNILRGLGLEGQGMSLTDIFEALLDAGKRITLLLDDLDVSLVYGGKASLEQFISTFDRNDVIVLGTSAPSEYHRMEKFAAKNFKMRPFTCDEVASCFIKHKSDYHMENEDIVLVQPAMDVCRNPLHMRMLFELYKPNEIPEDISKALLYDRYWQRKAGSITDCVLPRLYDGQREAAAGLKDELARRITTQIYRVGNLGLETGQLEEIKKELAGQIAKSGQSVASEQNQNADMGQVTMQDTTEYSALIDIVCRDLLGGGLLAERKNGQIHFLHQTWFEYSAARSILEEEKQERLIDGLLDNITSLKNRAIIGQLIIQASSRGENQISRRLMEKLSSHDSYTKILAIDLLRQIDGTAEKEAQIYQDLAGDIDLNVKIYLTESLRWIIWHHPELASSLTDTLRRDKEWAVRKEVAKVLPDLMKRMEPGSALAIIETLRRDRDWAVRTEVARGLPDFVEGMKPAPALGLIEAFIGDRDSNVRKETARVLPDLIRLKPNLTWAFVETMSRDSDSMVRIQVARVLPDLIEVMKPVPALGLTETMSRDRDSNVRKEIVNILPFLIRLLEPDPALGLIERLSRDRDWAVRKELAKVLPELVQYMKPDPALGFINALSGDRDWAVRKEVAQVIPDLVRYMEPDPALGLIEVLAGDKDGDVRKEVAKRLPYLIQAMKPETAIELMDVLSRNKDSNIREAAAKLIPQYTGLPADKSPIDSELRSC